MKLSDFDYHLPKNLIAQKPISPRDHSRLLVLPKSGRQVKHCHFYDIVDYLQPGDVLVLNNTKVFPARLIGNRQDTGGSVKIFLLKQITGSQWQVLIGNRRKKIGQVIVFGRGLNCKIEKQLDQMVWQVKFNKTGQALEKAVDQVGCVPIPPYIKGPKNLKSKKLKSDYQTVFAQDRGSVAAPTAGFHFTKKLIAKLKKQGVQFEYITLHVGLGTFEPVKEQRIEDHKIHRELAIIDSKTALRLNKAKKEGRRIIAVGTTSTRTLESFANKVGQIKPGSKETDIFIYPGYEFKFIDGLITNFHLPKSTLIMLVAALIGRQRILKAYRTAVLKKYRFYSFGDAMLIDKSNK